jgi:hypothetical protein
MCDVSKLVKDFQFNFARQSTQLSITKAAVYIFCMLICMLVIFIRFNYQLPSPGQTLWAEDGLVFLNDATHYGPSALFRPYAGYLHFYPRLTSLVASFFDLVTQPTILLFGWILSLLVLIFSLVRVFKDTNKWAFRTLCAVFLIMLQPTNGEIFLNITNSQWILGSALFLICLSTSKDVGAARWIAPAISLPLSLTGPFSVVLLPIIAMKLALIKDWHQNRYIYISIIIGSIVQIYFLNTDNRESRGELDTNLIIWIESTLKILLLGAKEPIQYVFVAIFWVTIITKIVFEFSSATGKTATLLLIAALLMILAGLMSHSHNPSAILALGSGNRYTWVPYSLIITATFLVAEDSIRKTGLYAICLLAVFTLSYSRVNPKNTFFYSYAAFREVENIIIPINPGVEIFPGWHIPKDITKTYSSDDSHYIDIPVDEFEKIDLVASNPSKSNYFDALTNDPMLIVRSPLVCESSQHFGLAITMERPVKGWAQVFFSSETYFTEDQSFKRWYPEGRVVAHFAFPYQDGGVFIRIDPIETPDTVNLESVKFYCLRGE